MLTQERLKEVLYYHPESGDFVWLVNHKRIRAGCQAGCIQNHGYVHVRIDGKYYLVHRLAWFYTYGVWPAGGLDHRELLKTDNRIKELREASQSNNCFNTRPRLRSVVGIKGISWDKKLRKYKVQLMVRGVTHYLGIWKTIEEAIDVCAQGMLAFHGDFVRVA